MTNILLRFVPLERDRTQQQQYFQFGELKDWPLHSPERVLIFSGGLDSLAGAVETATGRGRSVLVSHRPAASLDSRQKKLFAGLRKQFSNQLFHIPVCINKADTLGRREPTQRTRSFLYLPLGTLVGESVQSGGVRFYENGIVSLNLPIADEALRARASRTTHPLALHLLSSLCAAVTERNFTVDNPYHQKSVRTAWRKLTEKAGVKGFRVHDLRHQCLTEMAENDTPPDVMMALAGHVSEKMRRHYVHVRDEAKKKAVAALPRNRPLPVACRGSCVHKAMIPSGLWTQTWIQETQNALRITCKQLK